MAPPAADVDLVSNVPEPVQVTKQVPGSKLSQPLKNSGSLDQYESFDVTKVIGREFPTLQLSSILNDDAKLRDLAVTGSKPRPSPTRSQLTNPTQCRNVVLSSSVNKIT